MIGKISVPRGEHVGPLLYYLFGPGRHEEHTDPHIVAGWRHPAALEPPLRADGRRDFAKLTGLLLQPQAAMRGHGYARPVWHCAMRTAPEDRLLSDDEWAGIAHEVMHRTGLSPYGQEDEAVRWIAVRHGDNHIHIVAMLARQDGGKPSLNWERYKVRAACLAAEHPLFDALVRYAAERTAPEVAKGAVFFDPDIDEPVVLRFLIGDVVDGNGEIVRRTLAAARVFPNGRTEQAPAASLFDVVPPTDTTRPAPEQAILVAAQTDPQLVMWARQHLFERVYEEARAERHHVASIQDDFLRRSFNVLIAQADTAILAAEDEKDRGVPGADGRLRKAEITKAQHEERRRQRLEETERGRAIVRGDVTVIGSALLLPLPAPDRGQAGSGDGYGRSDSEIEQIAVRIARQYEVNRGATVTSVEQDHVGFDLLSLRALERRCIEVKGRAGVARVELTWSEFAKSQELGDDYWLYVVLDCATPSPRLYRVRNPARTLATFWQPSLDVRFRVDPEPVIDASLGSPE